MNSFLDKLLNKVSHLELPSIKDKFIQVGYTFSEGTKKKIAFAIRDKAYKSVVKEATERGIDIIKISTDDLENLIADKEKEIYNKVKDMSLAALLSYLGIELSGF